MAILEMSKISVFGLHSDRKALLEALHKQEIVEICETNDEHLHLKDTAKSIIQFDKYMQSAESALAILDEYAPEKSGFFANRRMLPMQKYHMASADSDKALYSAYHILGLQENIQKHLECIRQITAKQMALEPYLALDIPMNIRNTAYISIKIGTINGMWTVERLQKKLEDNELLSEHLEIISTSKEYTYIWFVFLKAQEQKVNAFLQKLAFSEPAFSFSHHTPRRKFEVLEEAKSTINQEIQEYIAEIKKSNSCRHDIELLYDHLSLRKDKYQVLSRMGMTEHTFLIEGYIPKKHGNDIKKLLESKYTAYAELANPESPANVPIAFQNNVVTAPVEEITETYSMPSCTDVDPNPVMAFFYYLFFGMMFSDAGYGLLLMLVCGYLGFGKRLDKNKKKSFKMFFFCGVSTVFWGLMYGSFFGDMIYTFSLTFLGREIALAPIWLDPVSQAMELLIFSVSLGMIQILVGLGIKFYTLCRQKKIWDAVFDVGLWILTLLGICMLAAGMGASNRRSFNHRNMERDCGRRRSYIDGWAKK